MKKFFGLSLLILLVSPFCAKAEVLSCESPLKNGAITQDIQLIAVRTISMGADFQTMLPPVNGLQVAYRDSSDKLHSSILLSRGERQTNQEVIEEFLDPEFPAIVAERMNKNYIRVFLTLNDDTENQILILCHTAEKKVSDSKRIEFAGASFIQNIINSRIWVGGWVPTITRSSLEKSEKEGGADKYQVRVWISNPGPQQVQQNQEILRITSIDGKIQSISSL